MDAQVSLLGTQKKKNVPPHKSYFWPPNHANFDILKKFEIKCIFRWIITVNECIF